MPVTGLRHHGHFPQTDRVVMRDGGFDCCGSVDGQRVLFETSDSAEIQQLREHTEIVQEKPGVPCGCCGYPRIDWYSGDKRLALTALKHGYSIRWKGIPSEMPLTGKSVSWLANWLRGHGVPES